MSNNRPSVRLFSCTVRLNATCYLQTSRWCSAAAAARRTGTDHPDRRPYTTLMWESCRHQVIKVTLKNNHLSL